MSLKKITLHSPKSLVQFDVFEKHNRANLSQIALFTDNIPYLHYNEIEHECEAISGKNDKYIARNCLMFTLNCIVMQMSKVICEKGY